MKDFLVGWLLLLSVVMVCIGLIIATIFLILLGFVIHVYLGWVIIGVALIVWGSTVFSMVEDEV